MVPPGVNQYAFLIDNSDPVAAIDREMMKLNPTWGAYTAKSAKNLPAKVNFVDIVAADVFDVEESLPPRSLAKKIVRKAKVKKWSFERSCFKDIMQDTDELLNQGFELDYLWTRPGCSCAQYATGAA